MMEIHPNLYVGNADDYERKVKYSNGWCVVQACKEPYHRQALGYTSRAADKSHPEYLIAKRGNRLILNMIDPDDYRYLPKEIIDAAVEFIKKSLDEGYKVLVHCNQGESRAPSICFLYLLKYTDIIKSDKCNMANEEFKKLYPQYNPAKGILDFINLHFLEYRGIK